MKNLLWLSMRAPYKNASKAGYKCHYFYLCSLLNANFCDIELISFSYDYEYNDVIDSLKTLSHLKSHIIPISKNKLIRNQLKNLGLPPTLFEYLHIRKNVFRELKRLKKKKYNPHVIILHWTEIVLLERRVRKEFPNSKIVSIEEDVTFLKLSRKTQNSSGVKKFVYSLQEKILRKKEIKCLSYSDRIVLNNPKDYNLVIKNGIKKEKCILTVPYFENLSNIKRFPQQGKILFWGAMDRPENIEAVLWFVDNILPSIPKATLYVVGANPDEKLKRLDNDNVIVTGFVDDPTEYFSSCMCLVAPLKGGAGIKIKVLEAMSAGIPVLTNDVGIEGIPARNGYEYYHCETIDDYVRCLSMLVESKNEVRRMGEGAKQFICNSYNLNENILSFVNGVGGLLL